MTPSLGTATLTQQGLSYIWWLVHGVLEEKRNISDLGSSGEETEGTNVGKFLVGNGRSNGRNIESQGHFFKDRRLLNILPADG